MKIIKKEDVENLSYKDIAFLLIENNKKGLNTLELFTKIVEILELSKSTIDNKIADFYTSMTTDKRFVLVDGLWDLRTRHTLDKIIIKGLDDDNEEDDENIDEERENLDEEDDEEDYDSLEETDYNDEDEDNDDLSDLVVLDEDDMEESNL